LRYDKYSLEIAAWDQFVEGDEWRFCVSSSRDGFVGRISVLIYFLRRSNPRHTGKKLE
jgi:hypothetical protein